MSIITAINVSNYFINQAVKNGKSLSLMQVLKLTYIAQGVHLSLLDKPFFKEEVVAWKYGPVVKVLYDYLKELKDNNHIIQDKQEDNAKFEKIQLKILRMVFGKYSQLSAWDLSDLTHENGTPWEKTYSKKPGGVIEQHIIKEYFKKIITPYAFDVLFSEVQSKTRS